MLIIPLAVSVHSIVSWDWASSIVPALHQTIFAPYFVVGAIYSGTAGIVTVMFLLRKYMNFERYITQLHFDNLGKLLLALSLIWTYINVLELFTGWYSGASTEIEALKYKLFGYYAPLYWEMILFCAVAPLLLISKRFRTSFVPMLILSIAINIGMYTERFLIVGTSLSRKYLPDAWGLYVPSLVELSILVGSVATVLNPVSAVRQNLPERVHLRGQGDAARELLSTACPKRTFPNEERPNGNQRDRTLRRSSSSAGSGRQAQERRIRSACRDVTDPAGGADEVLGKKKSAIKRFTFFGAILGGIAGFTLAAGTAVLYLHPTGGRPIIPFPPFLIITYEMTILFGILATVIGFLISARLPAIRERAMRRKRPSTGSRSQ